MVHSGITSAWELEQWLNLELIALYNNVPISLHVGYYPDAVYVVISGGDEREAPQSVQWRIVKIPSEEVDATLDSEEFKALVREKVFVYIGMMLEDDEDE